METCKNCKTEVAVHDVTCGLCEYPLQGTEQEQSTFIAKQIVQKSEVQSSVENLDKSRWLLFAIGIFNLIFPFLSGADTTTLIFNAILGGIFCGFGFMTYILPKLALTVPLTITALYYLFLLLLMPHMFWSGIAIKVAILLGMGYGLFSVWKADKILKANPYLASVMMKKK
ncbi:hypothetical protein V6R21_09730 [Limibacter armeniacum]|uniref:hypothetical protein n=1 Tax=Limibacter armeniacum TaxID=466084 RepID=UPI002FE572EA